MRWHTLYNKNIVLNILSNIFGEQIEDYVQNCVIRLENNILEKYFNIRIIFTIQACIIASVIVTLPLMYQSIKTSIFAIDQDIINASKLDGASDFKIFTKIILPLCKNGIYSGILLSFARSLGEFGATILVAGNIPGKTQTLPMAMYNAIEANQTKTTIIILFVILSISILLIIIYHNLNKDKI